MTLFLISRISMFFNLLFLNRYSKKKYKITTCLSIYTFAYLATAVLDFFEHVVGQNTYYFMFLAANAVIIFSTSYLVSKYNDFRPLFVALTSSAYVLPGTIVCLMIYGYYDRLLVGIIGMVVMHMVIYLILSISIGDKVIPALDRRGKGWGGLCLLPLLFYITTAAFVFWPQKITDEPKSSVGIILLMTLMIATFVILISFFTNYRVGEEQVTKFENMGVNPEIALSNTENTSVTIKAYNIILLVSFIALIAAWIWNVIDNSKMNAGFREISFSEMGAASDIGVEIKKREDAGSSWSKEALAGTGSAFMLTGVTYDVSVINRMDIQVDDWSLRLDIPGDCYINQAWCGQTEIHQFVDGVEIIQTVDLRAIHDFSQLELKYIEGDSDLLIPLKKGDFIIYKPNGNVYEYPIEASTLSTGDYNAVTTGYIFYFDYGIEPLAFKNGSIGYKAHQVITQRTETRIIIYFAAVWVILFMFLLGYNARRRSNLEALQKDRLVIQEVMESFTGFVDAKDEYTAGHSDRVAEYSRMIAKELNFTEEEILNVYYCGQLHDCGKIGVPEAILNKPGRLTDAEFDRIKSHTTKGYDVLKNLSSIPSAAIAAKYHHERYDGKGYPEGLKGEDIPIVARIICVADSFDAMNSNRIYRKHLDKTYIMNELTINAGTQFDPKIAKVFLKLIEQGKVEING